MADNSNGGKKPATGLGALMGSGAPEEDVGPEDEEVVDHKRRAENDPSADQGNSSEIDPEAQRRLNEIIAENNANAGQPSVEEQGQTEKKAPEGQRDTTANPVQPQNEDDRPENTGDPGEEFPVNAGVLIESVDHAPDPDDGEGARDQRKRKKRKRGRHLSVPLPDFRDPVRQAAQRIHQMRPQTGRGAGSAPQLPALVQETEIHKTEDDQKNKVQAIVESGPKGAMNEYVTADGGHVLDGESGPLITRGSEYAEQVAIRSAINRGWTNVVLSGGSKKYRQRLQKRLEQENITAYLKEDLTRSKQHQNAATAGSEAAPPQAAADHAVAEERTVEDNANRPATYGNA